MRIQVIAVDTNILVAAHRRDHPFHAQAFAVLKGLSESLTTWGIPLHVLVEFYGKVTHPRIWKTPSTPTQAWAQMDEWTRSPALRILPMSPATLEILKSLCESQRIRGSKIHDARIAAVCLHHQVSELWSVDRDFSRFVDLRTRNPL